MQLLQIITKAQVLLQLFFVLFKKFEVDEAFFYLNG